MQVEEKFFDNSFFGLWRLPSLSCLVQQPRWQPIPQMLCYSQGHTDQEQQERQRREALGAPPPNSPASQIGSAGGNSPPSHGWATPQSASSGRSTAAEAGRQQVIQARPYRTPSPQPAQATSWTRYMPPQASSGLPWIRDMWNRITTQ
mmetsp:Transcript_42957/g.78073  ORF Transcript_42957/g.78073 Transcript_42957/m.78073 type:complete len:148 (-) Transcript_42957:44-487(-)